MESRKKFWKPPSFEDFHSTTPSKKIKLDTEDFFEDKTQPIPSISSEPKNIEELAIHPKKVAEVRNWIKLSTQLRAPILLVTGPAGCGKTTTVKVSAKSEGMSVKEWINPVDKIEFNAESVVQSDMYDKFSFSESKQTDKFEDFIFRSSRYNSLFQDANSTIIVVEDIPNIYVWKPKLFHEFLQKYIVHGKSPIVFIVTDDQNLNLHNDLFPNHIKNKFNITQIKFNPVNNSSLVKNLKSISECYFPESVSSQFLESICKSSGGDLRNATNNLFLFLRTNQQNLTQIIKKNKKFKKNDGLGTTPQSFISKDCYFDFYQIIGRILYPKLMSDTERSECENQHRKFLHDVFNIADNWSDSFLPILHENYLQTFGKFKDVVKGADCFAFCDYLRQHQELEEYSSLVGVISLMSANSEPKKRGFNPIKKSFKLSSNKPDFSLESDLGLNNLNLSERDVILDLVPYVKIIHKNENFKHKVTDSVTDVANEKNKTECESDEDVIEIEDCED